MKILWIEDFGGGLSPSKVIIEMFSSLVAKDVFDAHYDADEEDIPGQLAGIFDRYTLHQIYVCKSFLDWKRVYEGEEGDFDIALIDINLEAYKTPIAEMPAGIDAPNFDRKAGFHIYHQLIKNGFPDENIAFFTGEENSLKDFSQYCGELLIERPRNTFEKKPSDLKELRAWLLEKAGSEYLILRRGIIEGCRFMKAELQSIANQDLDHRLLFYRTTDIELGRDPESYRAELMDYLTKLEGTLLLRRHSNRSQTLLSFVKELAEKWDASFEHFSRAKQRPVSKTKLEERFYATCQFQMKRLRNWSVHNLLSHDLSEQVVAYLFVVAMRSWISFELEQTFKHERILSQLFPALSPTEIEREINSELERKLEQSYHELKWSYKDMTRGIKQSTEGYANDDSFLALVKALGEVPERVAGNDSELLKRQVRDASLRLLYQSFWHGLFPSWIKSTYYGNLQSVGFNVERIPMDSFLYFLGSLILKESFNEERDQPSRRIAAP